MTKIKKIISAITSVAVTAALSSCSLLFKEPEKTNAEFVLQYIQERNTDAIYDMLCKKLQETPNIKEQIEQTFDFIEGDVISYENGYISGDGKWSDDGKTKMDLGRSCKSIKTTSGNLYHLGLSYYDKNDFEPELIGIYHIYLYEMVQDNSNSEHYLKELHIECQA